jgi:hypothetical protein
MGDNFGLLLSKKKTETSGWKVGNKSNPEQKIKKENGCSDEPFGGPFWQPHPQ